MRVLTVLLAAAVGAIAGSAHAQATPPKPQPTRNHVAPLTPLSIYIASGDEGACGDGCSEWIAAEGAFDPGSAARLRRFLDKLGDRKLPIFFDSPGGVVAQALVIGRLLREREMTAGVAKTQSAECEMLSNAACAKLKRSGRKIKSDLVTVRAQCNSACVYALAGAKERLVWPGAHLGIHADKLVRIYNDGRMIAPTGAQLSPREKSRIAGDRRRLKSYIVEMGLSGELIDAATAVSHDTIHRLSPDEVARYGIDTRTFQETRWMISDMAGQRPSVLKYITEGKGPSAKEYRSSQLRLTCVAPRMVRVDYIRGLASFEVGTATAITIAAGDRRYSLTRIATTGAIAPDPTEIQSGSVPYAFFETAQQADAIVLTEADERSVIDRNARVVKLSTGGLSRALSALQPHCGA
ncbi:MAG TPA: hypothetical protein VM867_10150 [Xanthobacteraceae bacterium]|nr:hypothetical protein [Xanthobacteraceae bacterium]